ncbi:hypothetical protein HPB50_019206 [Hyalomma asiaticum]|uniref:Uncharacterized protein n=1 Tax=Hyalomma asiaticum TaxID=266040 RepID=A0ACB7SPD8_HYAAI|nr:hypothetical protein HPB50_019206 [Hyalomma asiaticum]
MNGSVNSSALKASFGRLYSPLGTSSTASSVKNVVSHGDVAPSLSASKSLTLSSLSHASSSRHHRCHAAVNFCCRYHSRCTVAAMNLKRQALGEFELLSDAMLERYCRLNSTGATLWPSKWKQ